MKARFLDHIESLLTQHHQDGTWPVAVGAQTIPHYLTRQDDLNQMIWFLHKDGEPRQSRIPATSGPSTLAQCGIGPNTRFVCEWPRRELQPGVADPCPEFDLRCLGQRDYFGSKVT